MNAVNTLNMYVLEGLDATGKTTVLKETEETLRKKGYAVLSFSIIHADDSSMLQSFSMFLKDILKQWEDADIIDDMMKHHLHSEVLGKWAREHGFESDHGHWNESHCSLEVALQKAKPVSFNKPTSPIELSEIIRGIVEVKNWRMKHALGGLRDVLNDLVSSAHKKNVTDLPAIKVAMLVDRYVGSTVQFVNDDLNRHNYMHDMNFNFLLEVLSEWHQYIPVDTFGNVKLRWVDLQASLKERKEFAAKRGGFDEADVFESNSFKYHDKMVNKITDYWSDIEEFSKKGLVMEGINFQTKVVKNNIRKPLKKVVQEILS